MDKFLCYIYQPAGVVEVEAETKEDARNKIMEQIISGVPHVEVFKVTDVNQVVASTSGLPGKM